MKHSAFRIVSLLLAMACLLALGACSPSNNESPTATTQGASSAGTGTPEGSTSVSLPAETQPEAPPEEDPAAVANGTMALYYDFSKLAEQSTTLDVMNALGWRILTYNAAAASLESVTDVGTCYSKGNELSLEIKDGKLYCSNSLTGVGTPGDKDVFVLMADSDYMALAASKDYVVQYKMVMEAGTRYFGMALNHAYSRSGNLTAAGNGFNVTKMFLRPNGKGLSACNMGSSTLMHFDQDFYDSSSLSKIYPDGTVKSLLKQELTVTLVSIRADSDTKLQVGEETLGSGLAILVNGVLVSKTVSNKMFWDYFGSSTIGDVNHDCYGIALLVSLAATISEIGVWTLDADAEDPLAMPAVTDTTVYREAVEKFWASVE